MAHASRPATAAGTGRWTLWTLPTPAQTPRSQALRMRRRRRRRRRSGRGPGVNPLRRPGSRSQLAHDENPQDGSDSACQGGHAGDPPQPPPGSRRGCRRGRGRRHRRTGLCVERRLPLVDLRELLLGVDAVHLAGSSPREHHAHRAGRARTVSRRRAPAAVNRWGARAAGSQGGERPGPQPPVRGWAAPSGRREDRSPASQGTRL